MLTMKNKILILGSGFVSGAVVNFLGRNENNLIVIASAIKEELEGLKAKNDAVETIILDVSADLESLSKIVKDSDIILSLLPNALHVSVIKECIRHQKHIVHASYVSEEMKELDSDAKKAGIIIFNEIGLDPGIDHLLAMKCIDEIHAQGGKVKSFISYCGGLPAPEFSDNPLRYKFSWSPRTALINLLNGARYLEDGQFKEVAPGGDLLEAVSEINFLPGFALEGHPNRDSLLYRDLYGIPEVETLLRGTLRYRGFADSVKILKTLGLLSVSENLPYLNPSESNNTINTWRDFIANLIGATSDSCEEILKDRFGKRQCQVLEDLGLLEENLITKCNTPLDTLSAFLTEKLAFESHERDIVIMRHEIVAEDSVGEQLLHEVNLVVYGDTVNTGFSAMAKTVGYAIGIATEMILAGEIKERGMLLPFSPSIYLPMIERLSRFGICPITNCKKMKI